MDCLSSPVEQGNFKQWFGVPTTSTNITMGYLISPVEQGNFEQWVGVQPSVLSITMDQSSLYGTTTTKKNKVQVSNSQLKSM